MQSRGSLIMAESIAIPISADEVTTVQLRLRGSGSFVQEADVAH
jgi:hypothetical protein